MLRLQDAASLEKRRNFLQRRDPISQIRRQTNGGPGLACVLPPQSEAQTQWEALLKISISNAVTRLALCAAAVFSNSADSAVITNGFTYSVSDAYVGLPNTGTHFHSNTGGAFGNPAGKAEVGGFFGTEVVRGLSEYNLGGIASSGPAFVTFNVYRSAGLFGQLGGAFLIDVYAYKGNNAENLSDYEATATAMIGTFSTAGLAAGDIVSLDVDSALDSAISLGDSSFGIRLQAQGARDPDGLTFTFDGFRLTTDNQCTGSACQAPEPSSLLLAALGIIGIGLSRKSGTALRA